MPACTQAFARVRTCGAPESQTAGAVLAVSRPAGAPEQEKEGHHGYRLRAGAVAARRRHVLRAQAEARRAARHAAAAALECHGCLTRVVRPGSTRQRRRGARGAAGRGVGVGVAAGAAAGARAPQHAPGRPVALGLRPGAALRRRASLQRRGPLAAGRRVHACTWAPLQNGASIRGHEHMAPCLGLARTCGVRACAAGSTGKAAWPEQGNSQGLARTGYPNCNRRAQGDH